MNSSIDSIIFQVYFKPSKYICPELGAVNSARNISSNISALKIGPHIDTPKIKLVTRCTKLCPL